MDKELNVTAELTQAAEHNDNQLYIVSKILYARYNEQEMFMSCWSRGVDSLLKRPPGNLNQLWLWMFRKWWQSSWSRTRT
jgi:hypothetical protein